MYKSQVPHILVSALYGYFLVCQSFEGVRCGVVSHCYSTVPTLASGVTILMHFHLFSLYLFNLHLCVCVPAAFLRAQEAGDLLNVLEDG